MKKLNPKVRVPKSDQVRVLYWKKTGISLTALSSKGNLVNFVCGAVTLGQPRGDRKACKAEAARQRSSTVTWGGEGQGR